MDREQARQEIRREWRRIIPVIAQPAAAQANHEQSYICPFCGHGTHGDGMTVNKKSQDGNGLHCFGCGWSGDIISLYQQSFERDYNAALTDLSQIIGITIDPYRTPGEYAPAHRPQNGAQEAQGMTADKFITGTENAAGAAEMANYTAYYEKCAKHITEKVALDYLAGRGISFETAAFYNIGYDPAADPANAPGAMTDEGKRYPMPRIIIPTTTAHYIGRSIYDDSRVIGQRTDKDGKIKKYDYCKSNPKNGTAGIFNLSALYAQDVQNVFVTEGAFDALSVIEAGSPAIALNSASNADILIKQLEAKQTKATFILCLDSDEAGRKASEKLKAGLLRLNIPYITADICCGHKDPNEALTANREAFIDAVMQAQSKDAPRPDNTSYYIDHIMSSDIEEFKSEIKTGFADLDKKASGGIYAGLYVIAAISSLGKTTFAQQLCDQIAAAGNEVLFFSLEQSRLEMVTKSIARRTFINDRETAVKNLSIRKGYLPESVRTAAAQYKQEVQDRISIIEGNFNCTISFIGDYVRNYINRNKTKPVIFIDYLQVLQPEDTGKRQQTTKETIDSGIVELKRISRELNLPVFVISSVNRANYLTPIDFESLKESGGIEYTADVIWGLQFQCLNDPIFDKQNNVKERREKVKAAKAATPRKIELVCLKNRYGKANFSTYFNYFAEFDYFEECSEDDLDFTPENHQRKAGRRL